MNRTEETKEDFKATKTKCYNTPQVIPKIAISWSSGDLDSLLKLL